MVTICQQCGDKGWNVALIYCCRCINFAIHRYCLPKIPPTFDEFVHWACEDCLIKLLKVRSLSQNHNPILSIEGGDELKKTCLDSGESSEKVDESSQDALSSSQLRVDQIDGEGELNDKRKETCLDTEKINKKSDEEVQDAPLPLQIPEAPTTPTESEVKIASDTVDSKTSTDENKDAEPPGKETKKTKKKKRRTPIYGNKKRRKAVKPVSAVSKNPEETEEVDPTEHTEVASVSSLEPEAKSLNDTSKSKPKSDETITLQTTNEEKKKKKRKRWSPICGRRKRRKAVGTVAQKQEETEILDPAEHAELANDPAIESETEEADPSNHSELASDPEPEGNKTLPTMNFAQDSIDSTSEPDENKTLQTTTSADKTTKKRKSSSHENQNKRKVVKSATNKPEETEEVDPAEHTELATESSPVNECQPSNEKLPSVPVCTEKTEAQRLVVSDNDCHITQVHNTGDFISNNSIGVEQAKPVFNPIWRGNFSMSNKKYNIENGVAAHLSNKACSKVWDEAKLFPISLCLEMHPKAEIWPKSFQLSPPSDNSIALYFFPTDKSCEGILDQLIEELMRKEIALRTTVQNAELLIFPSMELPFSHWRFQGKYYLWGVFRGKQQR